MINVCICLADTDPGDDFDLDQDTFSDDGGDQVTNSPHPSQRQVYALDIRYFTVFFALLSIYYIYFICILYLYINIYVYIM